MTKQIILSTIAAATLFGTSLSALTLEERIAKLEKIIQVQQKTIEKLTKHSETNKNVAEDVEDIDERLDIIETRSFTDKIKFGMGMRVEFNNYTNTYADGSKYTADDIWRTKLNINMKSKIANNLKFTGRLSMYKNWGDSTPRNMVYDSMQGRRPDSSAIYVERAYLDWQLNPSSTIPVIVTIGRQPSSDGPSYNIKENTTRKGTYDALATDGASDGIVFTANLNKVIKGTTLRLAYGTPNVLDNEAYTPTQMSYVGNDNDDFKNTKVTGLFVDKTFDNFDFENLAQVYYIDAKNFDANPAYETDPLDYNFSKEDVNIGDFALAGFMVEASKINNKLDLFAHYAMSEAKPIKNIGLDMSAVGGSVHTGLLTDDSLNDTSSKKGHAIWLGARYHINNDWKIGAEYNKGSKNWFSFTSGSNDPLNKLATRGDAIELYLSTAVNKHANLRLGYVQINYDYTGSGSHLGAPKEITDVMGTNVIKETKNAYLTFNVLF